MRAISLSKFRSEDAEEEGVERETRTFLQYEKKRTESNCVYGAKNAKNWKKTKNRRRRTRNLLSARVWEKNCMRLQVEPKGREESRKENQKKNEWKVACSQTLKGEREKFVQISEHGFA